MNLSMICAETGEEVTFQQSKDLLEMHGFEKVDIQQLGQISAIIGYKPWTSG